MTEPDMHSPLDNARVDIQWEVDPESYAVDASGITRWIASSAAEIPLSRFEVAVRIVDSQEITELNHQYRDKTACTNVLSFPNGLKDESGCDLLGDIVICAPVVRDEAEVQHKTEASHFAHILIHGLLHLCGYDHQGDEEAKTMEAMEVKLLHKLAFDNPYFETECDE